MYREEHYPDEKDGTKVVLRYAVSNPRLLRCYVLVPWEKNKEVYSTRYYATYDNIFSLSTREIVASVLKSYYEQEKNKHAEK